MDKVTISGREYRVEVNWNAVIAWLEATDNDEIGALAGLESLKPSDLAPLMAASINEGERLEGRKCEFTAEQIGSMCDFETMGLFIGIFARQTSRKDEQGPKKKQEADRGTASEP